jgi:hypothetical protein
MRVVAIATMVIYVLGLPATFVIFLWRNRRVIEVDQRLRERGEGDSALTNPHIQVRVQHSAWGLTALDMRVSLPTKQLLQRVGDVTV